MKNIKKKAVFLDRDGVINEVIYRDGSEKPSSPWDFEEFRLIPGIKRSLEELNKMGFYLFVISNQPDISRGLVKEGTTERINNIISEELPITEIRVCPHDDYHNCNCRKPKPGMIFELSKKWKIDLEESFLIGDNWKDIEAGKSAGLTCIIIDMAYNKSVDADYRAEKIEKAVELINSLSKNKR